MNRRLRRLRGRLQRLRYEAPGLLAYWCLRPHVAGVDPDVVRETWDVVADGAHNSNTDLIFWNRRSGTTRGCWACSAPRTSGWRGSICPRWSGLRCGPRQRTPGPTPVPRTGESDALPRPEIRFQQLHPRRDIKALGFGSDGPVPPSSVAVA